MSWAKNVKKSMKTAGTSPVEPGAQVRKAGIYAEQEAVRGAQFRQNVYAEADKVARYQGTNSAGRVLTAGEGTMFTNGEINAGSRKEAVDQLAYAATQMGKVRGAAMKKATDLTQPERDALLKAIYADNNADRTRFAQQAKNIVYDRLDYVGITDDILTRMDLQQGAVPYVEKDINVPAIVVAEDAKTVKTQITGDRVYFDEFRLTSLVTADIGEVAQRAYSIIDRIFEKVPRQLTLEEDRMLMRSLYRASNVKNSQLSFANLSTKTTMDQFAREIERHRIDADKYIMNRYDFSDIRTSIQADTFDPLTSRDIFVSGYMGKYFGYNLFVTSGIDELDVGSFSNNEVCPQGHMFVVGTPNFVGYQAVRIPLDVYAADQMVNGQPAYGWFYFKQEGMIITNPRAVVFGLRTGTTVAPWLT